ncbi:glycosyltransferase family 4 protein [Candidatus Woesearchaeota archaeon]|nr:glycosyltransferase family 4 protein [Candidatus Woesearchaeota archaeon]
MKIAIITDETEGNAVGMGTYILNLTENILKTDRENEYFLIHRKKEEHRIYSMANEIIIPYNPKFPFSTIRNFITLPKELRKHNFDIIHHPTNIGPFAFKSVWPTKKGKCIQTIHDLIPLLFKNTHEKAVRMAFEHILPRVARNCDKIITVSQASKRDIISRLKVSANKISVIYEAASDIYKPQKRSNPLLKYGANGEYILFVGALEPKKNLTTLIKAYSMLRNKDHKLVLCGKKGWYYKDILGEIMKHGIERDVIFTGYVPLEEMPAMYSNASVFCFPSLYEGFGLPVLEAMKCGVPVIASNTGSIPEIAGNAAIFTDPNDPKELSEKIDETITSKKLKETLKRKGIEQASKFSWKKTAKETIKAYQETTK